MNALKKYYYRLRPQNLNYKKGHLLRTFSGHEGAITSIQTSGEKVISTTIDNNIRVFKINWEFVK